MSDLIPRDSRVTEPTEIQRLSAQNQRVLQALQAGPKTNVQLAHLAMKYTSRISDLRAAGYRVDVVRKVKGLVTYALNPEPKVLRGHDLNERWDLVP